MRCKKHQIKTLVSEELGKTFEFDLLGKLTEGEIYSELQTKTKLNLPKVLPGETTYNEIENIYSQKMNKHKINQHHNAEKDIYLNKKKGENSKKKQTKQISKNNRLKICEKKQPKIKKIDKKNWVLKDFKNEKIVNSAKDNNFCKRMKLKSNETKNRNNEIILETKCVENQNLSNSKLKSEKHTWKKE